MGADLASMENYFRSEKGRVDLGYGGDGEDISLLGVERVDGALYAVLEDASEFGPAFAGDEICRAFTEVNGRMVMVTSLSRRNAPPKPGALRAELESVVAALRGANT